MVDTHGRSISAPRSWEYWIYPELRRIDPAKRSEALLQAKQAPFDGFELVGVVLVLVLVAALTKYSILDLHLVERIGRVLANFIVAVPLLLILLSPL